MADKDFEAKLRADLPRGHARQSKSGGREHALFARWLTPAEITGNYWLNPADTNGADWKAKGGLSRRARDRLARRSACDDHCGQPGG
jgi:hypothetical protein